MSRDPRRDPAQGDKVWWPSQSMARRRTVEYVTALGTVVYSTGGAAFGEYRERSVSLASWRRWAKGNSVATTVDRKLSPWDETVSISHETQRELLKLRNELKRLGVNDSIRDGALITGMVRFCFAKLYHHSPSERFKQEQLKEVFGS